MKRATASGSWPCESCSSLPVKRGDELGRFNLGSTVILVTEPGRVDWELSVGADVKVGQRIARVVSSGVSGARAALGGAHQHLGELVGFAFVGAELLEHHGLDQGVGQGVDLATGGRLPQGVEGGLIGVERGLDAAGEAPGGGEPRGEAGRGVDHGAATAAQGVFEGPLSLYGALALGPDGGLSDLQPDRADQGPALGAV